VCVTLEAKEACGQPISAASIWPWYVWHVWYVCVTCLIHMQNIRHTTHSYAKWLITPTPTPPLCTTQPASGLRTVCAIYKLHVCDVYILHVCACLKMSNTMCYVYVMSTFCMYVFDTRLHFTCMYLTHVFENILQDVKYNVIRVCDVYMYLTHVYTLHVCIWHMNLTHLTHCWCVFATFWHVCSWHIHGRLDAYIYHMTRSHDYFISAMTHSCG